jgi:hypothetical protein
MNKLWHRLNQTNRHNAPGWQVRKYHTGLSTWHIIHHTCHGVVWLLRNVLNVCIYYLFIYSNFHLPRTVFFPTEYVEDLKNFHYSFSTQTFPAFLLITVETNSIILSGLSGTRWHSWLRHYATSRKVAGSIPDWHNPSGRATALGSTQSLTEMSTRNISWGVKAAGA